MFSGFACSYQKQKLYASDMLLLGLYRTCSFLRHSRISWIFGAAFSAPFFTAYFIVREISYIRLLKFTALHLYKSAKNPGFLYFGIGLLLVGSFFCVFMPPYAILEKEKSRALFPQRASVAEKTVEKNAVRICDSAWDYDSLSFWSVFCYYGRYDSSGFFSCSHGK